MTKHRIEILTFNGCPHASEARRVTNKIASCLLPEAEVLEVNVESDDEARRITFLGSPSIRIDGEDIEGRSGDSPGLSCRIYGPTGGVPPEWMIEAAILRAVKPKHILFLCAANSARSQMAEGIARSLAPRHVRISSAGSQPTKVHPEAISALDELGIDTSGQFSKGISDIDTKSVEAVLTLCAEEVCPAFLGTAMRIHWGLQDPASGQRSEREAREDFRKVRDELKRRLDLLFR